MRTNNTKAANHVKPILRIMLILGIAVQTMFTACGGGDKNAFADLRDGKKYKFATIGGQTWMAENLRYEAEDSRCYGGEPEDCEKYGRYYNWEAAMKACPDGWHLPGNAQWSELFRYADGDSSGGRGSIYEGRAAGKYLKAKAGWKEHNDKPGDGEDKFGFAGLPGGLEGGFLEGVNGFWWSASASDSANAYFSRLDNYGDEASLLSLSKTDMRNIRCVKESLCNEKPYNAATHFCLNGTDIAERCGDSEYNPETQFCRGKDAIERCGGKEYDPETENCVAGEARAYKTVKIGKYTWMAENLNYPSDGSVCYDNKPENCDKYGRLYGRGASYNVCPAGWHRSTSGEWLAASAYGSKLRAKEGWNGSGNGGDNLGFAALPGGYGNKDGSFGEAGDFGGWWTAQPFFGGGYDCFGYYMLSGNKSVSRGNAYFGDGHGYCDEGDECKLAMLSVRCVKDYACGKLTYKPSEACCANAIPYNPYEQFCHKGKVYDACGDSGPDGANSYDPATEFCYEKLYNPEKDAPVWDKCGGNGYNPELQYCSNKVVKSKEKCGDKSYNPDTEYCSGDAVKEKERSGNDINSYRTVVIGKQTWMADNLNYEVEGSKCYENNDYNCSKYGRLYDWATAMALPASCNEEECSSRVKAKHRGICPEGWHLPMQEEWNTLSSYVQTASSCSDCDAKHLKAAGGWNSGGNGLDSYGFAALPGGGGNSDGYFIDAGNFGYWWSSSEDNAGNAYSRGIGYRNGDNLYGRNKTYLFSVRCLQD